MARRVSRLKSAAGALAVCAALVLGGQGAAQAKPDHVVFAWPGVMSPGYAPFTFAQELGFFKQANIDLDTVLLKGSGTIIPQIVNGSLFTAFITLNPLIVSREPGGPNFPLRYVYNVVRNSIWEISVLKDSPIHGIKDLAGKSIGVGGLSFGNVPMTKALLSQAGVDLKTVQLIPVGLGVPAFDALRRGKVDALNLYDLMDVIIEQQGTQIRRLPLPAQYQKLSSYGFPVTETMIKNHPDLIARFGRAFTEGVVACEANLKGCLLSYWKLQPSQKPAVVDDKTFANQLALLKARLKNMVDFAPGETKEFGAFSKNDWTTTIEALKLGDQIKTSDIPLDSLYTNRFVAAYNHFDHDAVRRKAEAYKP
jgi:NitT/TauT family transport system substrate-binding protein